MTMKKLLLGLLLGAFFYTPAQASWIKPPQLLTYEVSAVKKKPVKKAAPTALVRSGLLDDGGRYTAVVVDGLKKQGYAVTHLPWWAEAPGKYLVATGHSLGADRVLHDNAAKIIAIDPTMKNTGCVGHPDCTAYYGPANKFPLIVCCGGYPARGANNIAIGFGHTRAPQIALQQILNQTRTPWTKTTSTRALKISKPQSDGGTISRQDIPG
jgi:hypothetical protein